MIAIVALRLPALGFCLCEQEVILNNGSCCPETVTATEAACPSDPCECCPGEITTAPAEPCRDCVVVLTLDPGDFTWSADQFSPAPQFGTPLDLPAGLQDDLLSGQLSVERTAPIRGSPLSDGPPLYLRTRVLKL